MCDIIEQYENFLDIKRKTFTSDQFERLKEHILGDATSIETLKSDIEFLEAELLNREGRIEDLEHDLKESKELNKTYENEIDELTQRATDLQDIIDNLERKGYN